MKEPYAIFGVEAIRLIQKDKTIEIKYYNEVVFKRISFNKDIIIVSQTIKEFDLRDLGECTIEIDFRINSFNGIRGKKTKVFYDMNLVKEEFKIGCTSVGEVYYVFSNYAYEEIENEIRWLVESTLKDEIYEHLVSERNILIAELNEARFKKNHEEYRNILESLNEVNKCIYMNFES